MKKILTAILLFFVVCTFLTACSGGQEKGESSSVVKETAQPANADERSETQSQTSVTESTQAPQKNEHKDQDLKLQMAIGDTPVSVAWENNEAVQALTELCREQPLAISMSMYGGFEQVGSIGTALPQNDVQTITSAGDIVLYSGDQIVVFYGSNSWAYTRLGHITDQTQAELEALLSNGNVTVTLTF